MAKRHNEKLLRQIAERLRDIRKELKITQDVVKKEVGVAISEIEGGRMNPTIMTIAILCQYYDVSLEDFFRGIEAGDLINLD